MMAVRRGLLTIKDSIVPAAYQQVEYLQTDGGQYITGISATFGGSAIEFYIKYRLFEIKNYGPHIVSAGTTFRLINRVQASSKSFFTINNTEYGYGVKAPIDEDIVAYISGGKATIDSLGDPISISESISGVVTFSIMCYSSSPTDASYRSAMRFYSVSMCNSNGFGFNLIPCVRKLDSKPGMYDTVSKTFYTNSGTGEFIVPT